MMKSAFCCVQGMQEALAAQQKALEDARSLCKQMCDNIKETSTKFDVKNKLAAIERPFKDIQKKLGMSGTLGHRQLL